jgi:hypothetical protein
LSVATWLFIDEMHTVTSADVILDRLRSVYIESWTCLPLGSLRGDLLNVEFNRSLLTRMALR